ncbi:hypothetical protein PHYPSEUDO_006050 [Phytophthora pseudosyringae]|uniref:Uncharacterized protein n=1 Tax=Phytophthora pseudosyringae TaxID=221518 RepID=A0A8T1VJQ5_9STRA|nr:hypothetical protein PHYPSEUDO_006050 [Phytophthora pseudosyringae]
MADKSELVAFEREKRLYKDAYVENFRSVRYFPSLATIGAGRTDGDSIVLVQEPPLPAAAERSPPKGLRSRLDDVASRLIPPDSLEEIFDTTLPLTTFRSAVMCKHTKARQERRAAAAASGGGSASRTGLAAAPSSRHGAHSNTVRLRGLMHAHDRQPGVFKSTSAVGAKGAIQRKVAYDGQPFQEKPRSVRPVRRRDCDMGCNPAELFSAGPNIARCVRSSPQVKPRADAPPPWAKNNPASARKEICDRTFLNVPSEGPAMLDASGSVPISRTAVLLSARNSAKSTSSSS